MICFFPPNITINLVTSPYHEGACSLKKRSFIFITVICLIKLSRLGLSFVSFKSLSGSYLVITHNCENNLVIREILLEQICVFLPFM